MTEPERRRRRPAVSCTSCRKRKVRCNREQPCNHCTKSKTDCRYEGHPALAQRQSTLSSDTSLPTTAIAGVSNASTPLMRSSSGASSDQVSILELQSLKEKIKQLEQQISRGSSAVAPSPAPSSSHAEILDIGPIGCFTVHGSSVFGHPQWLPRSITHKTRLYGQSHWIHTAALFKDVLERFEPATRDESSKGISGLRKCKSLATVIKAQRTPPWPLPPTTTLPTKEVADELIESYLRTIERVYRILHIPLFRADYEKLWVPDTQYDIAFLVQVKLVLALGAIFYDDTFSLRETALRWIYEAQTWLSEPEFKSRLGLQYLQTHLLHLLAREFVNVGGDYTWVSAGSVLRIATYMGLNRDPAQIPSRTRLCCEMRRRLWNTILELALQSSLMLGAPPLITTNDFDTQPPGNFDDEDLLESEKPAPKSETEYTQTSMAIALRKSFQTRLSIAKFLNDLNPNPTYQEALRLHSELHQELKDLRRTLSKYKPGSTSKQSIFEVNTVDYLMNRYLSSVHTPYLGYAMQEASYAFSRKAAVESALRILYAGGSITQSASQTANYHQQKPELNDLPRLICRGSGFFRTITIQALLVIVVEVRAQLQEEEGLGSMPIRPDLISAVEELRVWNLKSIKAGETNIKGHLFANMIVAQIDGLRQRLDENEMTQLIIAKAEESIDTCLSILEELAAQGSPQKSSSTVSSWGNTNPMDDWDLMTLDGPLPFDLEDPMNWSIDDTIMEKAPFW
ncbi:hypothetical protein BU24DRAFT_495735 [Aaosphaeria arxii CBS 175.79]|uniref:Zn(2)-C6 fungal-type domain-containing protein n=1 Tax=Aaosphaeria arxii CBS 175.79 TaxID=1450172 RepID=A0A6A5XFH6_9PLEO|nr:uncharacterized protein BU24DRAFT_495735 [Aaosphaeria arxii CBS 175.79]KAF2011581.1 hypothetical protein BU24DRAFT_495735 [Aaosphaeria arxii CBS 175.79]